jgi:anhydro-N-acetylmuramic acid kinase
MSGTSADAIDAALVAFDPAPRLVQALAAAYPADLRAQILALSQAPQTRLTLGRGRDPRPSHRRRVRRCRIRGARQRARQGLSRLLRSARTGRTLRHCPRGEPAFTLAARRP